MGSSKPVDINKNAQKKAKRAARDKITGQDVKQQLKQVQMSLVNMRQMYEASVQEKAQLQQAITELRTIIGGIMVATKNTELVLTPDTMAELQSTWTGYEMDVNEDGNLEIVMSTENPDE